MTISGKLAVVSIPNFMKVLFVVGYMEQEGNIKQVSDKTKLSYSTVTRLISRFETQEKWLRIKRDKINPANNKVSLTSKGKKILYKSEELLIEMGFNLKDKNIIDKIISKK